MLGIVSGRRGFSHSLLVWLAIGFIFPAQTTTLLSQSVASLVRDVSEIGDGSVTQARIEASRQAANGNLPYRSFEEGDRRSFAGQYTPPQLPDDKNGRFVYGLALFSDDGSSVSVLGNPIHQLLGRGQHLPSLADSFHVLPVALAPEDPVDITVDYSNIIYDDDPRSAGYPDIDGATLFLYLIPAGIAVDANRDGKIVFSGETRDTTGPESPFRFWINDDNDGSPASEGDVIGPIFTDYQDGFMLSARDLEDFARLHLFFGAFEKELTAGTFRIGLKFKTVEGTPRIRVYKSTDTGGSDSYLKDDQAAFAQISDPDAATLGEVADGSPLLLPVNFWSNSPGATKCLLFEAGGEGKGELIMTINKSAGVQIGEVPGVWLDLKNIKKMYQRGTAQPDGIPAPHSSPTGPFAGPTYVLSDPLFENDSAEEKKAVVFVHGWSMTYDAYRNSSETMFKRLWHQGFKGRFCSFRWDPLVGSEARLYAGEYNRSEHRAFLYGQALRQFVESIKEGIPAISLLGHSMGNIVCGSALQQGLTVQNYLLLEGAVPAGCYDESGGDGAGGVNGYDRFWEEEEDRPTPDYHAVNKGYRGFLTSISSNAQLVNFHNRLDFALATGTKFFFFEANWEKNQVDYKPDGSPNAIHAGDWSYFYNANETDLSKKGRLENVQFYQLKSGIRVDSICE